MRTLAVAQGVAWRMLHNFFTNKSLLIPSLVFPLFFFTAFAGGLAGISNAPGFDFPDGYTAFQFVFVLLQSAAFAGVFTGFGIARDFESGFARRLLLASPNRSGIVLGYAIAALVRWLVTASLLTAIALAVRMKVGGGAVDLFGLYALGADRERRGDALGGRRRDAAAHDAGRADHADAGLPRPLLRAGLRAALAARAAGSTRVAVANPLTPRDRGRAAASSPGEPTEVAQAFLAAAVLGALFLVWAIRGLRKAEAAG